MAIKSIEWLGFYESALVSVRSEWMRDEVIRLYQVPEEKIFVISTAATVWLSDMLKIYAMWLEVQKVDERRLNSDDA